MTIAHKTIAGIIWNFAEQIGRKGIGMIVTLLLARFLAPSDFGLIAMMAVFLAVGTSLMDSGFKQALIRLQGADQTDFNTAFYANLALGLLSYILLFLAAPQIAHFYNEPRLIVLVRTAGIGILINSFQVVQSAILSRNLNFSLQFRATIPAGIISGLIAVLLAFMGFGVWALIIQMLVSAFINTVLLWKLQSWRPSLGFSRKSLGSMYNFGYKLFLSGLLERIFENLYLIVIAKMFTATVLGHYFFADKIQHIVFRQLVGSIQNVTYPALSILQHDNIRLKAGYRKVVRTTTFLLSPTMFFLAVLAQPAFQVFLPDKWLPAVPYLQLLCFAGLLHPLHAINLNIIKVKGRSELFLYLEIYRKLVKTIIIVLSVGFGIYGILYGQIISSILAYIPNSYFSSRLIAYPVREQLADFMPGLSLSFAAAVVIYGAEFLVEWPAFVELLVLAPLAWLLYFAGAHFLNLTAFVAIKEMAIARISKRGKQGLVKTVKWT
ncbi:MAG: flippase [Deltaproteobacteria bacterium HGW-Deltaproteobacteria-15]|jgi:O-antigen/teichoic acid export membrane protein|nr:MAG: flippase [Deltaproteobacteria bacterium HGW-Deltaproteobacteria-15]